MRVKSTLVTGVTMKQRFLPVLELTKKIYNSDTDMSLSLETKTARERENIFNDKW